MDTKLHEALGGQYRNYCAPFLWLHNEDDSLILRELERIHACGIRAVCLESRTHEEFCRDDWWSDMRLILEFCRAHGMKAWILDDKHFPSGYAGGIYEQHPELTQWNITECHMDLAGPVTEGCVYADAWLEETGDELLRVYACRHIPGSEVLTGDILDLTENVRDGYVYLTLPEGAWRIVFLIKTRRGLSDRYRAYSDKLSAASTQAYIEAVYEPHYRELKEYFGNTLLGFFSDEPAFGNNSRFFVEHHQRNKPYVHYPWHASVGQHFEELYGPGALRCLLGLWFEFDSQPYRDWRVAYMNFVTDGFAEHYTGHIARWCRAHGVQYIGHIIEDNNIHCDLHAGPGHFFKALREQDMAGIDVVLCQILPGLTACNNALPASYRHANAAFFHYVLAKLGASLAHITPHMRRRAMCEIFGAFGWAEGTRTMKYLADHMLVRGINYFVPHAFSPLPDDPDCPPNFYASGQNPQYKYFDRIIAHMDRVCHLMEGTVHVNSCAILYDAESVWSGADRLPLELLAKQLYDSQLDYDILPPYALESMDKNGCINGEHYGLILAPGCDYLRAEVRTALQSCGVPVAVVSDTPDPDFDTVALADVCGYVRSRGLGDVELTVPCPLLRCRHGVRGGAHIYMLANEDIDRTAHTALRLRGFAGGDYILYDAFENTAAVGTSADGAIPLQLAPYHSVLILTGDIDAAGLPELAAPRGGAVQTLAPEFTVELRERDGEPWQLYERTDALRSITGPGRLPRFSGDMRYTAHITLPQGAHTLDLGTVGEVAELRLNGRSAGVRLIPPYRFDISALAQPGANQLEVVVSNTLGTRIHDPFSKYMLLPPSGLLGPVTAEVQP